MRGKKLLNENPASVASAWDIWKGFLKCTIKVPISLWLKLKTKRILDVYEG